jgi:RNA polymerase sigma-70 factor (ECF subfamily)
VAIALHPALELIVMSSDITDRSRRTPAAPGESAELVAACRRGDRHALEQVFRTHAPDLARLLTRIVGPSVDVEDLLQDTFAAAVTAFASFRGEAAVRTWLHRIAIHVAHQHLRRPRHRREVAMPDEEPAAPDASPERRELSARLYAHLDALDSAKRVALVLYVIEGYTVDEIAVLVGASKTATRSRIFWGRRALLRALQRDPAFADRSPR